MRPDEDCDQCRFHIAGMCRRMPPAAHDGGRICGLPIAVWPLVRPEDWCGEFRRRTPDPPAAFEIASYFDPLNGLSSAEDIRAANNAKKV